MEIYGYMNFLSKFVELYEKIYVEFNNVFLCKK